MPEFPRGKEARRLKRYMEDAKETFNDRLAEWQVARQAMKKELEDDAQVRLREKMTQQAEIYATDRPNKQLWSKYQMVQELAWRLVGPISSQIALIPVHRPIKTS